MPFPLARRRFLTTTSTTMVAAGAWIGPAFGQDRKDGPLTGPYDFSNPYDWLAAYAKVRGRLDGGVGMYHYVSHIYGVPDGQVAQLMFRREGVSQHRMTIREDRTVDLQYVECNYTQHPVTGAVINDFYDNPLTGDAGVGAPPTAGARTAGPYQPDRWLQPGY